ncbi:response regulator [Nemorincola caseinilytica]|uniref:Response regulator n=1 Tax=Nemorincola caseinilytica TaxID=2054315 RepID=A0ABP8N6B8_9BACT
MTKKLECILLIDDDLEDSFFHKIVIDRMNIANCVQVAINGLEALEYLKDGDKPTPELIFLDINMPKMNGWEFLEEYKHLDPQQKARITILMLTTSINPADIRRAQQIQDVTGYNTKPLSLEMLTDIMEKHFPEYL